MTLETCTKSLYNGTSTSNSGLVASLLSGRKGTLRTTSNRLSTQQNNDNYTNGTSSDTQSRINNNGNDSENSSTECQNLEHDLVKPATVLGSQELISDAIEEKKDSSHTTNDEKFSLLPKALNGDDSTVKSGGKSNRRKSGITRKITHQTDDEPMREDVDMKRDYGDMNGPGGSDDFDSVLIKNEPRDKHMVLPPPPKRFAPIGSDNNNYLNGSNNNYRGNNVPNDITDEDNKKIEEQESMKYYFENSFIPKSSELIVPEYLRKFMFPDNALAVDEDGSNNLLNHLNGDRSKHAFNHLDTCDADSFNSNTQSPTTSNAADMEGDENLKVKNCVGRPRLSTSNSLSSGKIAANGLNDLLNSSGPPKRGYYKSYTREQLMKALEAVQSSKMSGEQAAKHFKVPRSTLHHHLRPMQYWCVICQKDLRYKIEWKEHMAVHRRSQNQSISGKSNEPQETTKSPTPNETDLSLERYNKKHAEEGCVNMSNGSTSSTFSINPLNNNSADGIAVGGALITNQDVKVSNETQINNSCNANEVENTTDKNVTENGGNENLLRDDVNEKYVISKATTSPPLTQNKLINNSVFEGNGSMENYFEKYYKSIMNGTAMANNGSKEKQAALLNQQDATTTKLQQEKPREKRPPGRPPKRDSITNKSASSNKNNLTCHNGDVAANITNKNQNQEKPEKSSKIVSNTANRFTNDRLFQKYLDDSLKYRNELKALMSGEPNDSNFDTNLGMKLEKHQPNQMCNDNLSKELYKKMLLFQNELFLNGNGDPDDMSNLNGIGSLSIPGKLGTLNPGTTVGQQEEDSNEINKSYQALKQQYLMWQKMANQNYPNSSPYNNNGNNYNSSNQPSFPSGDKTPNNFNDTMNQLIKTNSVKNIGMNGVEFGENGYNQNPLNYKHQQYATTPTDSSFHLKSLINQPFRDNCNSNNYSASNKYPPNNHILERLINDNLEKEVTENHNNLFTNFIDAARNSEDTPGEPSTDTLRNYLLRGKMENRQTPAAATQAMFLEDGDAPLKKLSKVREATRNRVNDKNDTTSAVNFLCGFCGESVSEKEMLYEHLFVHNQTLLAAHINDIDNDKTLGLSAKQIQRTFLDLAAKLDSCYDSRQSHHWTNQLRIGKKIERIVPCNNSKSKEILEVNKIATNFSAENMMALHAGNSTQLNVNPNCHKINQNLPLPGGKFDNETLMAALFSIAYNYTNTKGASKYFNIPEPVLDDYYQMFCKWKGFVGDTNTSKPKDTENINTQGKHNIPNEFYKSKYLTDNNDANKEGVADGNNNGQELFGIKKGQITKYTKEQLDSALKSVINGQRTVVQASKVFGVPYRTLYDSIKNLKTSSPLINDIHHITKNGGKISDIADKFEVEFPTKSDHDDNAMAREELHETNPIDHLNI